MSEGVERRKAIYRICWLIIFCLLGIALQRWYAHRTGVPGWADETRPVANTVVTDRFIVERFSGVAQGFGKASYEDAFLYLLEGQINYRSADGGMVFYPGAPSFNGRRSDGLEGFARFFPLAAAWVASGQPDVIVLGGRSVSVTKMLKDGLLAGTNRDGEGFWGVVNSYQQSLFESADVALGLWISRNEIWNNLRPAEKEQVITWLKRAVVVNTYENNWVLVPVMVDRVLKALGHDDSCNDVSVARLYRQFKEMALGGGWFNDGAAGPDYYNIWAMQYALFWLDQIDPNFDPQFIRESNREMVTFYRYLVSPKGIPLWGRSVCYRMAAAVPLLVAQALAPEAVSKGVAMRALDATWSYFVTHGALSKGAIVQGFCGQDLALVDGYTGPGSCLWSARSLVIAFYLDPQVHLFETRREKLPVEIGDFIVTEDNLKWTAQGIKDRGEVVLTIEHRPKKSPPAPIKPYGPTNRLREWLTHYPKRPDNHAALNDLTQYSTSQSITACELVSR